MANRNDHDRGNGKNDPKVTSIEEARRRAARKAKAAPQPSVERAPGMWRSRVVGWLFIVLALATVYAFFTGLTQGTGGGN